MLRDSLRINVSAAITPAFLFLDDPPLTAMNTLRTDASMVQVAAEPGYL